MKIQLKVRTLEGLIWNKEVDEVILQADTGQIGFLPNHESILLLLDIGVVKARIGDRWEPLITNTGCVEYTYPDDMMVYTPQVEDHTKLVEEEQLDAIKNALEKLEKAEPGSPELYLAMVNAKLSRTRLEAQQIYEAFK